MEVINENIIIYTDRLELQAVSDKFKIEICKEFTVEVTRYMPFMPDGNISATEEFIERSVRESRAGKAIHFCILKKETKEFLGCAGLHKINTKNIEIGLWLKINAHGQGFGSETVKALINLAESKFEIDYLIYPVDKRNRPSRNIAEKLGFSAFKNYEVKKAENEDLQIIEYRKRYKK